MLPKADHFPQALEKGSWPRGNGRGMDVIRYNIIVFYLYVSILEMPMPQPHKSLTDFKAIHPRHDTHFVCRDLPFSSVKS